MLIKKNLPAYLKYLPSDQVFEWLKTHDRLSIYSEITSVLLDRNDPLINLGIALYVEDKQIGENLYKQGDDYQKKAVLSGQSLHCVFDMGHDWVVTSGVIGQLIDNDEEELLSTYFSNEFISTDTLIDIFKKEGLFESMALDVWEKLIIYAAKNTGLSKESKDDDAINEYHGFRGNEVFESVWRLFKTMEVTDRNASILALLGRSTYRSKPREFDVHSVISRWFKEGEENKLGKSYFDCRTYLADLLYAGNKDSFFKDDDPALRCSYYRRFAFRSLEDVSGYDEVDDQNFVTSACLNEYFFRSEELRRWLEHKCLELDQKGIGYGTWNLDNFHITRDFQQQQNPEYFKDDNGDIEIYQITDPIKRDKLYHYHFNKKINKLQDYLEAHIENSREGILDEVKKDSALRDIYKTVSAVEHVERQAESILEEVCSVRSYIGEKHLTQSEKLRRLEVTALEVLANTSSKYLSIIMLSVGVFVGYLIGK